MRELIRPHREKISLETPFEEFSALIKQEDPEKIAELTEGRLDEHIKYFYQDTIDEVFISCFNYFFMFVFELFLLLLL